MGVSASLTIDWQPIAGCPSWWFPRARAGGRRGAAARSASLCCRWWSPRPGGEKLAWGTGSLQHHHQQQQQTNSEDVLTSLENNYVYVPLFGRPTLYCRYVSVEFGSAGEGCVLQHHGKQGRDERLQGWQEHVELVFIQTMFSLL